MKLFFIYSIIFISALGPFSLAQESADEMGIDYIDSSTLDIEGTLKADQTSYKKITPAEHAKQQRRNIEAQTQRMVKKKLEDLRVRREIQIQKKLQQAFKQQLQALDKIQ